MRKKPVIVKDEILIQNYFEEKYDELTMAHRDEIVIDYDHIKNLEYFV